VSEPPPYRETFSAESITVRECLLYALEQSGLLVGRMECLGRVFAASERFLHEVTAAREIDSSMGKPIERARDMYDWPEV